VGYIDPQARTDQAAYIHESAWLYGDVELAEGASVWINAALRAELYDIRIGRYTNLQDFVMVHIGNHTGTRIGDYCSITHHVTLHGCTIGDNAWWVSTAPSWTAA
jgi:carbonic anhydrase/acetyltransferase-like protein (isoleucine patch superfamily)